MPSDTGTEVHIFGRVYHIKGGDDPDRTQRVASLVDEKMNLVASQVQGPDHYRIAVLTALHLADEYLNLKQELEQLQGQVTAKSEHLASLLDKIDDERGQESASVFSAAD